MSTARGAASSGPSRQRPRSLAIPVEAVRVLHRHRRSQPVPATYAGAALAGLAGGLTARRAGVRRWWVGVPAALALTWAGFLTTCGGRPGAPLIDELRDVVDPGGARERGMARQRELVRAFPLPTYEVAGWEAGRFLGGWGTGRAGLLSRVELGFEDPAPGVDRVVRVATHRTSAGDLERRCALRLALHGAGGTDSHGALDPEVVEAVASEIGLRPPSGVTIEVDDAPVTMALRRNGAAWVAWTDRGDHRVSVEAHGRDAPAPDELCLRTVVDLGPYLERGA